jgi:DNA-binding PadR family transcriptional regulator
MRHVSKRHIESLTEPVFLILVSLAEEARHGYAILKDVETLSNRRIRMSTGTLYGALRRMLEDRWIEYFREADAPRERQAYRLTAPGRTVLNGEVDRMKLLARLAATRLARSEA